MLLADRSEARKLRLDIGHAPGGGEPAVTVEAVDGERSWTLTAPVLSEDEATELAAWLAGLAGDLTLGADEWSALTFAEPVLSLSGRRIPGGGVELRVALLGMRATAAPPGETTDVVIGLALADQDVREGAVALAAQAARRA
ncbi:MAG: WapI family immunity protein [Leifsonia sp.]|uniref:WapI family immunity protein n=1 Tax=Leifsonia sp. TaxID=1870902 RepID=UPI003F7EECF3